MLDQYKWSSFKLHELLSSKLTKRIWKTYALPRKWTRNAACFPYLCANLLEGNSYSLYWYHSWMVLFWWMNQSWSITLGLFKHIPSFVGKKSKFFQWQIRFPHHFWINRINFKSCPTWKVLPSRDSHPKCQPTIDFAICSAAGALPHFQRWFHPSEKLILTYPNHDAFEKMKCFSNASNKNNHPKVHRYISKLEIRNTHCLRILRNTVSRLFYLLQDDNIQTTTILEDTSINP